MKSKLAVFFGNIYKGLFTLQQSVFNWVRSNKIKTAITIVFLVVYYFCLPQILFQEPYSTVIESREGELLGARIASDGQWRFPAQDSIPYKFKKCIVYFEDQHFYSHPGFNPVAIVKAMRAKL